MLDGTFEKQADILYCFKLVQEGNVVKLIKYAIEEYELRRFSPYRSDYRFSGKSIGTRAKIEQVKTSKVDRIANNKLYTFDPEYSHAEEAFDNYFYSNLILAQTKLTTAQLNYDFWRGRDAQGEETAD